MKAYKERKRVSISLYPRCWEFKFQIDPFGLPAPLPLPRTKRKKSKKTDTKHRVSAPDPRALFSRKEKMFGFLGMLILWLSMGLFWFFRDQTLERLYAR